jgi:hypothetical protein
VLVGTGSMNIVVALLLVGGLLVWALLELFAPDHVGR